MQHVISHVTGFVSGPLPEGYEWGRQNGKYRAIIKNGAYVTSYGGTMFICCNPAQNASVIIYQIAKAECEASWIKQ